MSMRCANLSVDKSPHCDDLRKDCFALYKFHYIGTGYLMSFDFFLFVVSVFLLKVHNG